MVLHIADVFVYNGELFFLILRTKIHAFMDISSVRWGSHQDARRILIQVDERT
jgi:hypothetical protein